jgi:superfamily II DNA or RNA helicase
MKRYPDFLSKRFVADFGAGVRSRGQEYFATGAVQITEGDAGHVAATVIGAREYYVQLQIKNGSLAVSCTCPFFQDNEACKHIWAVMLEAEHQEFLGGGLTPLNELYEDWDAPPGRPPASPRPPLPRAASPAPSVPWRQRLGGLLNRPAAALTASSGEAWPAARELLYVVDAGLSQVKRRLALELYSRDRKQNGEWGKPKPVRFQRKLIPQLPNEADRSILWRLAGARFGDRWSLDNDYYYGSSSASLFQADQPLSEVLLPEIAATGRLLMHRDSEKPEAWPVIERDPDPEPWRLHLSLKPEGQAWEFKGELRREGVMLAVTAPFLYIPSFLFIGNRVSPLDPSTSIEWLDTLRKQGGITLPEGEQEDLFVAVLEQPDSPPLEAPESLRYERVTAAPRPRARIAKDTSGYSSVEKLFLDLSFDYGGHLVHHSEPAGSIVQREARRVMVRDRDAEEQAVARLAGAGLKPQRADFWHKQEGWLLSPARLPKLVRELSSEGWLVEAEGKLVRSGGKFEVEIVSGIDWFDLRGGIDFGEGATAALPDLLRAARRGESMVRLDDGSYGILPEDWLKRFGAVLHMGEQQGEEMRFRRSQAGILDALLAAQPEIRFDEQFGRMRDQLQRFHGVTPAPQPEGFVGQLRGYQLEGLGWLQFLNEYSIGGCLADDMGVGKTAQVLALLETRRSAGAGMSLVVVPKSLVFNWQQEAARFTPQLRVLEHAGLGRSRASFKDHDVILTTYGTLRRDVVEFQEIEWDYVVLDEATAIKNPGSESAKSVRLLKARNRLAMSGTPVENHLGELWSLFEFLNPGMLGSSAVMQIAGGSLRNPSDDTRRILSQALRPYILRRTKEQVARELPPKVEQTLYCELEPEQRKLYQELLDHYRARLLGKVQKDGLGKSKMQVLEALLRLRQAACHPALIDKKRAGEGSAKLELLRTQLEEVLAEGHKALVFSQFTSFLALLRVQLDEERIPYAYLDGDTRDREGAVKQFQEDPDCKLFLISLKAGGLGLNLTAADYVYLLDPWWNPAVEAQAIDRAHRIGQQSQVFAYRIIARDTVEEKVLKLQETKRDLADAIISADNSLIAGLKREDLELLLS